MKNADISHHLLSEDEFDVLQDIHQVLEIPHVAQELLSAEKTPTLSMALPAYETLIELWKGQQKKIPELEYFIGIGIAKIEEYVARVTNTLFLILSFHLILSYLVFILYLIKEIGISPPLLRWAGPLMCTDFI